ncbi:IclR family transcriptional regulator [Streptomyces sp. NPDC006529]|uniref:IclR family transcriptional regulator n=1 Tax=Streptomyces sp. NPDC006529 TaxID=3157177 RepID=UPI0033B6E6ED
MTTAGSAGTEEGAAAGAPVKSAVRTVRLLEHFAARPGLHSLADIQHDLGLPKSSLYMLLRTLVGMGWVETDAQGTRYGIGVRALLVGSSYIDGDEVVAAARPTLDRLSDGTTETIHLARLDGTSVVYLATRQSQHYLRPFTRVGRRLPVHSTALGKALLATHTDEEVRLLLPERLEAVTQHTITDREALIEELALVREQGYAVDREENTLGLRCFGVAVPYRTPARDAVSCSVPVARLTPGHERAIKAALFEARDRLTVATRRM